MIRLFYANGITIVSKGFGYSPRTTTILYARLYAQVPSSVNHERELCNCTSPGGSPEVGKKRSGGEIGMSKVDNDCLVSYSKQKAKLTLQMVQIHFLWPVFFVPLLTMVVTGRPPRMPG